jgi:hypothetical protein
LKPDDCDRVRRHHHHLVSMSLDVKPEHHHSRLARSTCCQRPSRCRTGRSVRLTHGSDTLVRSRSSSKPFKHTAHRERCQPKIPHGFPALEFGALLSLERVRNARAACLPAGDAVFGAQNAREVFLTSKDLLEVLRPFEELCPRMKARTGRFEVACFALRLTHSMPGPLFRTQILTPGLAQTPSRNLLLIPRKTTMRNPRRLAYSFSYGPTCGKVS